MAVELQAASIEGALPSPEAAFEAGVAGIHDAMIAKMTALQIPELAA